MKAASAVEGRVEKIVQHENAGSRVVLGVVPVGAVLGAGLGGGTNRLWLAPICWWRRVTINDVSNTDDH